MKLPPIKEGEVIVLKSEKSTGIILNKDNSYYLEDGNNYYSIFENINEAKKYIEESLSSDIEFIIYDNNGNYITTIRNDS